MVPLQAVEAEWMTEALRARCAEVIHMRFEDGVMITGGRAILQIFLALGAGWGVRLLGLPPLIWGVEAVYRLVAGNRLFFSRLFFGRR